MLRQLGYHRINYLEDKIVSGYHCINGASHNDFCCDTCWNHHPDDRLHLPKIGTGQAFENYNKYYKGRKSE